MTIRRSSLSHRGGGFTLLEAMIATVLVALVLTKLTMIVTEARRVHVNETRSLALEDQAAQVLDRIAFAIIGSDADSLDPNVESPFWTEELHFRVSLGVENGEVVWGDPEQIGLRGSGEQLYWGRNVGQPTEQVVVWCNTVSEMLEDELENGLDDNGNGLADELGLAFDRDGRSITIRLTLARTDEDGNRIEVTDETVVTCRN